MSQAPSVALRTALVLRVTEHACQVAHDGGVVAVPFAPQFPAPRLGRVHPGHLVAVASALGASDVVVWRWFDAVVLGEADGGAVRVWEAGHGEVDATPRSPGRQWPPGARAYVSAGLPGAEWWLADVVPARPEDADVELDAVDDLYRTHGMWPAALGL